jgi:hypothetical protein
MPNRGGPFCHRPSYCSGIGQYVTDLFDGSHAHRRPLGAISTTWVGSFRAFSGYCAGAPFIEKMRGNMALEGAMSVITAAGVGVILNFAVWFGYMSRLQRSIGVAWRLGHGHSGDDCDQMAVACLDGTGGLGDLLSSDVGNYDTFAFSVAWTALVASLREGGYEARGEDHDSMPLRSTSTTAQPLLHSKSTIPDQ